MSRERRTLARLFLILIVLGLVLSGYAAPIQAQVSGQIVYAAGPSGAHQLYLMNPDGTVASQSLTTRGDNVEPNWSPDRRQIAFTSDQSGRSEVHVIHADGSGERTVTDGGGYSPSWSADGRRLAFISDRAGSGQLFIARADGSDVRQLTNDPTAQASAPAWSPDNRTIAFVYNTNGASAIWLVDIDGSNLRQLTYDQTGEDYGTAWSPDGRNVAYISTVGGDSDLLVVDADGGNGRQIATLTGKYADNVTWSEDGMSLAFTAWARRGARAIFVVAVDGSGSLRQLSQSADDAGWPSWASLQLTLPQDESSEGGNDTSPKIQTMSCPGVLTSRLIPGNMARITPGDPNTLRSGPGKDQQRLGSIPGGGTFEVLSGPECNDYAWFQVKYQGQVGWTAEGDSQEYWTEPYDSEDRPSNHSNDGGAHLLTGGYGLTNGVKMGPGEFQVEYYCFRRGYGVQHTNSDWHCTSNNRNVMTLQQSDFDRICRETYDNPQAYAAQTGNNRKPAFNWRCYGP